MSDEQEDIEVDDIEEKAKKIGKDLGVEEPEAPDYDVIEEEDDERVAKEREPREKKERPVLTNKQKRDLRKKRVAEKFSAKDEEIMRLRQENDEIKRWKNEVDGRLSGINKAEVDKAYNDSVAAFAQAERDHMAAFTEGDAAKATASMRAMYDAQRRIDQLQGYKSQQIEQKPIQRETVPSGPDPIMVNKAKAWAKRNSWYKNDGMDIDSEIAKAISSVLANEGYDPKTDDYWDELDDRLAERLPDKYSSEIEEDEDDEPVQQAPRKRTSPPVGGGSTRGDVKGKKAIKLPTEFIQTLKANGKWDDKKKRDKIIEDHLRIQRENRNS